MTETRLFSPLTLRGVTFRNRIAIPPMCMYSAVDGYANDFHLVHYGSLALGGAGLIIQEATAVSREGRISRGDLGLWEDGQVKMLSRITGFIREQGSVPGIQLAHAGRKAGCAPPWEGGRQLEGAWGRVAPSPLPFFEEDATPQALDVAGITGVIGDFRSAARRALEAGFQVLEIHAAHGYLLHEFLSPLSNIRKDNYGGSFENRIRLLLEVTEAVKEVWPAELSLFVRLSATDWIEGGWNPDETVQLVLILKELGVDLIDTSSAGLSPLAKIPVASGFQVPFAERIRRETGIPTGAVGFILTGSQAEEILQKEQADLVLIGRESLRNPRFPMDAARELGVEIDWPRQYLRGNKERLR